MTYIEKNRGNRSKRIVFVFIGLIILGYLLIQISFPHFLPALVTSIVAPFWRTEFAIESGSLKTTSSLLLENEALKRDLIQNETKMTIAKYLEKENAQLRALLHSTSSSSYLLSAILKRPPFYNYDELIIDVGSDRKISTTSLVFANENVPLGRVVDVLAQTSKVVLFSSPGQKNQVLIGDDNVSALALGKGGGQFEVELPRGININEGDFVLLAELDARPIGKVVMIDNSSSLPFQKILFSTLVNIYQLRWVLVDTK